MTTAFSHQAVAFSLALLMTLGVLGGLSHTADQQFQAAQSTQVELAQATLPTITAKA